MTRVNAMTRRLRAIAGLFSSDRSHGFLLLTRGWAVIGGPVTVLIISQRLPLAVQGFYYLFTSLLALQAFVELSFYLVIVQFASHEWAHLSLGPSREIIGQPAAQSRLASLQRFAGLWYAVVAVLFVALLAPGGYLFLSIRPQAGVSWSGPWFTLVGLAAFNLWLLPFVSILEGCGQLRAVYFTRLLQGVAGSLVIWITLLSGGALWAASAQMCVTLALSGWLVLVRYRRFFLPALSPPAGPVIHWRSELWPMQWRLGGGGVVVYFMFSMFVPVMFYFRGAEEAGRMGVTWQLVNVLSGIAGSWITVQVPYMGVLVARREFDELDRVFWRATLQALAFALAGGVTFIGLIWVLDLRGHPLAGRVLPLWPTAVFVVATVIMQLSQGQSAYLRAHRQEPLLFLNVVSSVSVGLLVVILGRAFGAAGAAAGYLAVVALFVVPFETWLWRRLRREWHAEGAIT